MPLGCGPLGSRVRPVRKLLSRDAVKPLCAFGLRRFGAATQRSGSGWGRSGRAVRSAREKSLAKLRVARAEPNGKTAHRQVRLCDNVQTLRRTYPHSLLPGMIGGISVIHGSSHISGLAYDRARRIVGAEVPPNPSLATLRRVGRLLFAEITVRWAVAAGPLLMH